MQGPPPNAQRDDLDAVTDRAIERYRGDTACLRDRLDRVKACTASVDDMHEVLRLVTGYTEAGTHSARRRPTGTGTGDFYDRLLDAYSNLWEAIAWDGADAAALVDDAATRGDISGWPPTFVDVERVYATLDSTAAHLDVAHIEHENAENPNFVGQLMGQALGQAARRHRRLTSPTMMCDAATAQPFVTGGIEHAFELGRCSASATYYIVRFYVEDRAWMALLHLNPSTTAHTAIAVVTLKDDARPFDLTLYMGVPVEALSPSLAAAHNLIPVFLSLVSRPAPWNAPVSPAREYAQLVVPPVPIVDHIERIMLPVASLFALPPSVSGLMTTVAALERGSIQRATSGVQLDERSLVLALLLFRKQLQERLRASGSAAPLVALTLARPGAQQYPTSGSKA
jgi:hypothetical protein